MMKQKKRAKPCRRCGLPNLGRHDEFCREAHAHLSALADLSPEDARAVGRASAHAVHEELLEPAVRFREGVTDLDVARLLRALEAGAEVVQGGRAGWTVPTGSPLRRGNLAKTVNEAVRLGLAVAEPYWVTASIVRTKVRPVDVHLRSQWDNLRPACEDDFDVWRPPQRYRLVSEPGWADCPRCSSRAY